MKFKIVPWRFDILNTRKIPVYESLISKVYQSVDGNDYYAVATVLSPSLKDAIAAANSYDDLFMNGL